MDEAPAGGLAEQVHAEILHLRQLDIEPLLDRAAGHLADRKLGRSLQQKLQGYVVFLHEWDPCLRRDWRATERCLAGGWRGLRRRRQRPAGPVPTPLKRPAPACPAAPDSA